MFAFGGVVRADSPEAVVDKAIQALGGEAKLSTVKAFTWKAKGKISIGGNESEFTSEATIDGLSHFRQTFEGDFGGQKVKGITVVAGDKGWREFGDQGGELDKDALANAKRSIYLEAVTTNPLLLKEKAFSWTLARTKRRTANPQHASRSSDPMARISSSCLTRQAVFRSSKSRRCSDSRGTS